MDIIVTDHSKENLEEIYENTCVLQTEDYSVMAESTEIPWLQFIPNQSLNNPDYVAFLYQEIYRIAEYLKSKGIGEHYNVAKIGNILPYYHIHLVFRNAKDQAWPDTIWGQENLAKAPQKPEMLAEVLQSMPTNN